MSNTIHLPIKREWFDMILSGEKKEEYRDLTNHWAKRLTGQSRCSITADYGVPCDHVDANIKVNPKPGKTTVTLTNGYSPTSRRIVVELLGLEVKTPNPAWCPPGTGGLWFALKLGEVLEAHNLPVLAVR